MGGPTSYFEKVPFKEKLKVQVPTEIWKIRQVLDNSLALGSPIPDLKIFLTVSFFPSIQKYMQNFIVAIKF